MLFLIVIGVLIWLFSMALLPFGTDAPLYHFPFATIGVIILNVVAYIVTSPSPEMVEGLVLYLGGVLNPFNLLTCIYMHDGIMHLAGNMIYLWAFGTVVEGKVGPVKFLILYHAIGILESFSAWILCIGFMEPVATLGASGAIFGMMAMALVWAPANNVFCPYSLALGQEVSLATVAFFSIATNFYAAWMSTFAMSSALLHLLGGLFGAIFGIWMFKKGMVECEGYDLFAVLGGYAGDESKKPKQYVSQREKEKQETERELEEQRRKAEREENLRKLETYFATGHIEMGMVKLEMLQREIPGLMLEQSQLSASIRHFVGKKDWKTTVSLLREHIERFEEQRDEMRLTHARIIIVANRAPRAGVKVLSEIDQQKLPEKSRKVFRQLYQHARKMIQDGEVEVRDDEQ